jgi:Spy/CpxP family protein refolding chaperone
MTRRFLIAAVLLAAATLAEAQALPPGKWWRRDAVVRELGLTSDQQTRLDRVFSGAASQLIDARGDVEKSQIALRAALDERAPARAEIQKIASRLNDARGRLFELELMMLLDMRAVLTEPQWNRMRDFLDRMEEQRRKRGPDNGPDGPPNGPNRPRNQQPRPRPG